MKSYFLFIERSPFLVTSNLALNYLLLKNQQQEVMQLFSMGKLILFEKLEVLLL